MRTGCGRIVLTPHPATKKLEAHKIGGPKGVGALIRRSEDIHLADPLVRGGGQERGLRPGTEKPK